MVTSYRVWDWNGDRRNVSGDPEVERILNLLDPERSSRCALCGNEKSADAVTCQMCAEICPDPDCRGNPRGVKDAGEAMCAHCENFVRKLDAPCRGDAIGCEIPHCIEQHKRFDRNGVGWCFGEALERNGYFVYQLETGYIGMTYNPSRRQLEHDAYERKGRWVQNYMASRNNILDPYAYFSVAMSDFEYTDDDWATAFDAHWKRVRESDKSVVGERRIVWLSAPLPTRATAYRCEWALKFYRGSSRGKFPTRYREVVRLSSVPSVTFASANLAFDPATTRAVFALSWELSYDLGPSQIIAPAYYELERYDAERQNWIAVDRGNVVGFSDRFGASWMGEWRARAVNDFEIPGPWSYFDVSESDIATGVQQLVGLSGLTINVDKDTGAIKVHWEVAQRIDGLSFEVERTVGEETVLHRVDGNCECFDDVIHTDAVIECHYRVRAVLDEVRGPWEPTTPVRAVVGGALPGVVGEVNARCQADGSIRLYWTAPEWRGFARLDGYEVETRRRGESVITAVNATTSAWQDGRSVDDELQDVQYRVRSKNLHGVGPWSELVTVSVAARRAGLHDGLDRLVVLHPASFSEDGVSFSSGNHEIGEAYVLEVERFDAIGSTCEICVFESGTLDVGWQRARAMAWRSGVLRRGCFIPLSERSAVIRSNDLTAVLDGWSSDWNPTIDGLGYAAVRYVVSYSGNASIFAANTQAFGANSLDTVAQILCANGIHLLARVDGRVRGGLTARWGHRKCFIPASHVVGNVDERGVGGPIVLDLLEQRGSLDLVCREVRPPMRQKSRRVTPTDRTSLNTPEIYAGYVVRHPGWIGDGVVESMDGGYCTVRFERHPEYGVVRCNAERLEVISRSERP